MAHNLQKAQHEPIQKASGMTVYYHIQCLLLYILIGLTVNSTDCCKCCWKVNPALSTTGLNPPPLYKSTLALNGAPAKLSISFKPVNYNYNSSGRIDISLYGHMLLSSNFTPAESVAVAFNQKTQYDRIWQGYLFIILGPLLLPIPLWVTWPVGGSVALLQLARILPGVHASMSGSPNSCVLWFMPA